jgi:LAO/AO transport system kinase
VVLVPESGDSIQTLKAGLMEIADIFVVNKADRPGADRLRNDIELMLGLRRGAHFKDMPAHHGVDLKEIANPARSARKAASDAAATEWTPPVLRTVAVKNEGTKDLMAAIDGHFAYLERSGTLRDRRRTRLRERVVDAVEQKMSGRLWTDSDVNRWLDSELAALESGKETPYGAADRLLAERGTLVTKS